MKYSSIYTNAIDLAKKIAELNSENVKYEISIVDGIDGEKVVKVSYEVKEES